MIKKFWWIVTEEDGEVVIPFGSEIIKYVNVKNGMVFTARTVNELDPIYEKIKLILHEPVSDMIETNERLLKVFNDAYKVYIFEGFDKDIVFLGIKLKYYSEPIDACLTLTPDMTDIVQYHVKPNKRYPYEQKITRLMQNKEPSTIPIVNFGED